MKILGIDPGYGTTGFGIIESDGNSFLPLEFGVITTKSGLPLATRIMETIIDLSKLIDEFHPDEIALEEIFFSKNVTTALQVAESRGAIIYELGRRKYQVSQYKPNQVKMAVCGFGNAPKIQIQQMVKLMLNLEQIPKPDDAADALAIAICHAVHHKNQKLNLQ
ncbi:crossover junction endodeoxyribonuclease RuvC [Candidatus Peregrinibacteria bacterium]|nr:crossover junction endodeoxyribonuclease RuvC [Candidatus Peregrinibacteria bacterium]